MNHYYTYIHSDKAAQIKLIMFHNALAAFTLQYPKTKFIILPCFESVMYIPVGNCATTGPRLMNFAEMETELMAKETRGELTDRDNHLTRLQNQTLAETIIDIIDNKYIENSPMHVEIDLSKTY